MKLKVDVLEDRKEETSGYVGIDKSAIVYNHDYVQGLEKDNVMLKKELDSLREVLGHYKVLCSTRVEFDMGKVYTGNNG